MFQSLKSLIKTDVPQLIPKKSRQQLKLPLLLDLDRCNRYRPLFDRKTFQDDIENTDGELIQYFDPKVNEQYRKYVRNSKIITYSFWGIGIGFALYCHKIQFLSKIMGGQKNAKMLLFKTASLSIPYLFMDQLMYQADIQQMNLLYWQTKERYRRYKLTGDILQLNPQIDVVQSFLKGGSGLLSK